MTLSTCCQLLGKTSQISVSLIQYPKSLWGKKNINLTFFSENLQGKCHPHLSRQAVPTKQSHNRGCSLPCSHPCHLEVNRDS